MHHLLLNEVFGGIVVALVAWFLCIYRNISKSRVDRDTPMSDIAPDSLIKELDREINLEFGITTEPDHNTLCGRNRDAL